MPCASVTARAAVAAVAALAVLLFLLSQQQSAAQLPPVQAAGSAATQQPQPPAPRAALARTALEPQGPPPALPALLPPTPASAAAADRAEHLVTWSLECGASPTLDCCMGEWQRSAEPGDRPVHVANARAGAVQFRIAVYASGDIVSGQISGTQQWEGSITAGILQALSNAAATAAAVPDGADDAERVALTDVGANTGWYSWAAAVNGHRVRAYEPFRQNVNLLRLTACMNPAAARLVALHAVSLGNATQTCHVISETAINLGDGVTVCDPPHDINALPPGFHVIGRTPVAPLEALWDGARMSVFKMDTEGYELFVLRGAAAVLASPLAPQTLFLEFFPRLMRDRHTEPADLLRLLTKASGYTCAGGVLERDPQAYADSLGGGAADLQCELQRAR